MCVYSPHLYFGLGFGNVVSFFSMIFAVLFFLLNPPPAGLRLFLPPPSFWPPFLSIKNFFSITFFSFAPFSYFFIPFLSNVSNPPRPVKVLDPFRVLFAFILFPYFYPYSHSSCRVYCILLKRTEILLNTVPPLALGLVFLPCGCVTALFERYLSYCCSTLMTNSLSRGAG